MYVCATRVLMYLDYIFNKCSDKKVSRKHAILEVTSKGEVFLTPLHINPVFYQPDEISIGRILKKGAPIKLKNGDSFGLLPRQYRYQLIIKNYEKEILPELRKLSIEEETHMSLGDLSHEDYVPPRKMPQVFSGDGYRLGYISPLVSSSADCQENEKAQPSIGLDESQPQTSIQLQLADESREIPPELRKQQSNGEETLMSLDDPSHEDPRKMLQAFSGAGYRLGYISTQMLSSADCKENKEKAQPSIGVDESQPQTSIQLRLADGSRLVMNANHNHTVGDIKKFIVQSHPEYSGSEFSLMASFPTKELSDDGATLKEADLLHSVIFQQLKQHCIVFQRSVATQHCITTLRSIATQTT